MLTQEEIQFYRDEGYLSVESVFKSKEIDELRAVTDAFVERSRGVTQNNEVFDLEPAHTPEKPLLRRLKSPTKQHEVYFRALRHPGVLDRIAQLIGPSIYFNGEKLNFKPGEAGSPVEWHQDWAFYPHTNDDLLAVGIYLDDATTENGAMMVLPGSHKGPILDHHQDEHFVGAVTEPDFDPSGAVPIEVKAGGISIHHARTLHGSAPNRSPHPRRLLLFQYCAIDAWPLLPEENAWENYQKNILRGNPVNRPRVEAVPVLLPLPGPILSGSIYESQRSLNKSHFK